MPAVPNFIHANNPNADKIDESRNLISQIIRKRNAVRVIDTQKSLILRRG
jgi:hypothetical protein